MCCQMDEVVFLNCMCLFWALLVTILRTTLTKHFLMSCEMKKLKKRRSYLTKHGQLFGKIHNTSDGGGDNFCKLTEGFYVHFAPLWCVDDGRRTDVLGLQRQEGEGHRAQ